MAAACLLGAAAALIVACGSSGKGLIPAGNAGPLQRDFEEVAQAAQAGNGNCTVTSTAILKTERDFAALPSSIDAGLRKRLREGIEGLHTHALALCAQPPTPVTVTSTTPKTTTSSRTTTTTPPVTQTSTTPTTSTSTTTPTTSSPGGGTPAPGVGGGEAPPAAGNGQGGGAGEGAGGATPGAGGQEAGK